jgi:CRP/FNR family cyclic AMP-dependent transcriptional regulator
VAGTRILQVCSDLPTLDLAAGSTVIEQGRKRGALFVLVDGAVTITSDGVVVAGVSEPGAIFGEMSSLLDRPATTTVTVVRDSTFLVAERGGAYLAATPDAAIEVSRALAERLELMTSYLADITVQFAEHGGHGALVGDVMRTLIHDALPTVRPGSVRMPEVEY